MEGRGIKLAGARVLAGACALTSVANVITDLPKLTGSLPSDTGIRWQNPVSKSFLPKTKFRVDNFPEYNLNSLKNFPFIKEFV